MKSLRLKELEKTWWWRGKDFRRARKGKGVPGIPFDYSDDSSRRIALNYELMRRSLKGGKFEKSYLELDRETRTICSVLWAASPDSPYRFAINDIQKSERGWFTFDSKIQWNLNLNDNALKAAFMRDINLQRQFQGIKPKRHLKGKVNRRMSWKYVEILDLHQNKVETLNASQRHMASVGKLKAVQYFNEFKRALAKWKKHAEDDTFLLAANAPESYAGASIS